ncbi:MAG: hypothetical protein AABX51_07915, partial [Nanoarchaeota archaeon]
MQQNRSPYFHLAGGIVIGISVLILVGVLSNWGANDSEKITGYAVFGTGTDSDGDGFSDVLEMAIGTDPAQRCGSNAWPADFNNDMKVAIIDITSFLAPIRRINVPANYDRRYDLNADGKIAILDLTTLLVLAPPMFGEQRAFNYGLCTPNANTQNSIIGITTICKARVSFSWVPATGTQQQFLDISPYSNFGTSPCPSSACISYDVTGRTSFEMSELANTGNPYYWRIRAKISSTSFAISEPQIFSPPPCTSTGQCPAASCTEKPACSSVSDQICTTSIDMCLSEGGSSVSSTYSCSPGQFCCRLPPTLPPCSSADNQFCTTSIDMCLAESGTSVSSDYSCQSGQFCCRTPPPKPACSSVDNQFCTTSVDMCLSEGGSSVSSTYSCSP